MILIAVVFAVGCTKQPLPLCPTANATIQNSKCKTEDEEYAPVYNSVEEPEKEDQYDDDYHRTNIERRVVGMDYKRHYDARRNHSKMTKKGY